MRSNGTVTYVGKDIAYQLWKFGLLGKDFYYRQLHRVPGWPCPVGDHGPTRRRAERRRSAAAARVYNVIDSRQSYLQDVVVAGLRALGLHRAGGQLDPLLLRDGRAVAARRAWNWASSYRKKTSGGPTSKCPAARAWA